jgi:pimeloyl-ACP methyl ester carboxylesterase
VRPETRYARSGDVQVAYQASGHGEFELVFAPGTVSHLDLDWEWPPRARFFEALGRFSRLIRFDKRGTGLSDRPTDAATLEERTDDIRAVMEAVGSRCASIFGGSEGGSMACVFAATYPDRTRSLILWGVQARWIQTDDYPWGSTPQQAGQMISMLEREWPSVEYLLGPGAGLGREVDPAYLDWFMRYARAGASPSAIVALERMNFAIDVRDVLPAIRVPTLVMNRTGDPVAHVDAARDIAERIPGAHFVEFPGDTHSLFTIEPEKVIAEIEEFLTGTPATLRTDRALATILFADVVESTQQATKLGDARWRDLLTRHYQAAERALSAYGGLEIDRAGDGLFALFDGPTRAIRCAIALRSEGATLGLDLRSGVHTGEIERAGSAVRGIAVHVAARVAARAQPGEVLVSSTVKDLVAGSGLTFEDRGEHELKGIPGEWRLFAVER